MNPPEPFDKAYMRELFRVGYGLAAKGYTWAKAPPGWTAPEVEPPLPAPGQERDSGGPERAPSAAVATAFP